MKRVLFLLAFGCGASAPGHGATSSKHMIDAANGIVDDKYRLTMTHGDAMALPGATEKDGAIDFLDGKIALGFGSEPSVCQIDVSLPGAAMKDGPRIGDSIESWSKAYGATKTEEATGDTGFEHGQVVVSVDKGKVVSVRLGGCGE
jgi:hypothetical protein